MKIGDIYIHVYVEETLLIEKKTGNCDTCIDRKKVTEDRGQNSAVGVGSFDWKPLQPL